MVSDPTYELSPPQFVNPNSNNTIFLNLGNP